MWIVVVYILAACEKKRSRSRKVRSIWASTAGKQKGQTYLEAPGWEKMAEIEDTDSGMAPSFGSFNSGCGRSCHFAMSKLSKQILPHPTEVNGNAWQRVTPIFTPQEDRPVHRNPGTAETFSESLDEIRGRFQTRGCRGCGDLLYSLFSAWPSLHPKKKTISINFKQTCPCCFKNL